MRTFLTILILTIVFSSCAHKSAFESFKITKEQERSEDAMQSSKIENNSKTTGIVFAVYLNKVKPKKYKHKEIFYITAYVKKEFPQKLDFYLNRHKPLHLKELNTTNEFTKLTAINAEWFRYYLVTFEQLNTPLRLEVKNQAGKSQVMLFNKDE